MLLPVISRTKTLTTVFTLVGFNAIMDCLDMNSEASLPSKLDSTCGTLLILLLVVHSLIVPDHMYILSKPLPTLLALVVHTFVNNLLMLC